jgi:hypothetical protein
MATFYAQQQVGVADGSLIPAAKADGGQVGVNLITTIASKVAGQAWAAGDQIYLGRLRPGEHMRRLWANTDTSLATATISVGTLALPTKYANGRTLTATNVPTVLGPPASVADDGALTAGEDIWATIGTAGVGAAVNLTIEMEIAVVK